MHRGPVAITGAGAVSALGAGVDALWRGIAAGQSGIAPILRFATEALGVHHAALVPGTTDGEADALALRFAVDAACEAIADAALDGVAAPHRVALVFGTSLATHPEGIHRLAELVGDAIGAHGSRLTISTACASSANAVGLARDLLLDDLADVAIAGGADALTPLIFAGFHALGLLAPERCAPFSEPRGTSLGEGAAFVVLERPSPAAARGAKVLGFVSGSGLSCDAHHATSPDPAGAGIARATRAALDDAGLGPDDVDYVNAHGTGTEANDPAEWRGVSTALGARATAVALSATKSVLGHGQGAAGILEIVATLAAMQRGLVPQTLNHIGSRPRCPVDPVAQPGPRVHAVRHALCNSSAFGGANAVVVVDGARSPATGREVALRPVALLGAAAFGAFGDGLEALAAAAMRGPLAGPARAPGLPASAEPRSLDPLARLLTAAASAALGDAGLAVHGAARDRTGLFAALARVSPTSARELDRSVKDRGLARLSAPAFTRVVLNAATGACARALSLRGPTTTLTTGDGAGLVALVLAADHLATRADADALVVAAAEEIDDEPADAFFEGGAALVLGTSAAARGVRVEGWALAGPGRVEDAIARAVARAGAGPVPIDAPRLAGSAGAPAAGELLRAALACHRLRRERPLRVVIAHGAGSSATAAVVLGVAPEGADDPVDDYIARREAVLERVRSLLVRRLHVERDPDEIDPDVPLFGTGIGLDSVDAVELVVSLQDEFGLPAQTKGFDRSAMRTVGKLVDLVLAAAEAPDEP